MTSNEVSIRPMRSSDINNVANIHCECFPHSRSTRLGKLFIRKMYRWFIEYEPGLAFVAEMDGKPAGFISGSMGSYGRKLFRYTIFEIIFGFSRSPSLIFNKKMFLSWKSFVQGLMPKYKSSHKSVNAPTPKHMDASLASIGVAIDGRGKHIGEELMGAFENSAKEQGASTLSLSVEIMNMPARRLYEKCAWKLERENAAKQLAFYTKNIE